MVQPYNIGVKVGADIDPLRQELNKGSKEVQGFAARSSAALRTMASGFAIVGTAAIAAGGAILKLASDSAAWADDVNNMAKAAGTTAEVFQEMTFASKTLGVEQQKLSDIMRNSQKNLGEFALTGGGPLQKFFDDVLYKTGQTKDAFRDLSGPQGLQQFYNALEKAKLPQDQIISQMEKLAAGSSTLIPLLQQNGAAMRELGDRARDVGGVLSNDAVQALADLNLRFDTVKEGAAGFGRSIAVLLLPEVNSLLETLERSEKGWSTFINGLIESRKEIDKNAAAAEALEKGSEKLSSMEQAQGNATNNLLQRQVELREKIIEKERELFKAVTEGNKSQVAGLQKSLELMNQSYAANETAIQQHAKESELAKEVLEIRRGTVEQINQQIAAQEVLNEVSAPKRGDENEFENFIKDPFEAADPAKTPMMDEFSFGEDDPFATEEELFAKHWEEMNRIAVEGAGGVSQIMAMQWGNAVGSTVAAGKSMLESFSQSSRKMFEINKAWGIADAIVSTAQGIAAGVKLGWPMGIPAVAWAVANGAAQISRIRSTQFGGGGGTPTAATSAPAQGQAAPGTNALGGQESGRTLRIEGLRADSLYTGNQLQNLASNLEEFWNDGGGKGRVIFAGDK